MYCAAHSEWLKKRFASATRHLSNSDFASAVRSMLTAKPTCLDSSMEFHRKLASNFSPMLAIPMWVRCAKRCRIPSLKIYLRTTLTLSRDGLSTTIIEICNVLSIEMRRRWGGIKVLSGTRCRQSLDVVSSSGCNVHTLDRWGPFCSLIKCYMLCDIVEKTPDSSHSTYTVPSREQRWWSRVWLEIRCCIFPPMVCRCFRRWFVSFFSSISYFFFRLFHHSVTTATQQHHVVFN